MPNWRSISLWMDTLDENIRPRPALAGSLEVDVAIIGAGYTGLWTAYYLKRQAPELKIAINISPVQFRNPAFAGHVVQVLEETGIAPERVMLEMTEGYFIHHPERAQAAIEKLQQIGLSIALDDFGSGFASTGYLRRFGFDRMKIDKSLVVALEEGGRSLEMLTATVALARSLGMPVTAEGIETEDQAVILQICGCDELQGYRFSKPLDASGIDELLSQQDAPLEQLKAS